MKTSCSGINFLDSEFLTKTSCSGIKVGLQYTRKVFATNSHEPSSANCTPEVSALRSYPNKHQLFTHSLCFDIALELFSSNHTCKITALRSLVHNVMLTKSKVFVPRSLSSYQSSNKQKCLQQRTRSATLFRHCFTTAILNALFLFYCWPKIQTTKITEAWHNLDHQICIDLQFFGL
jgi:hypothetical protein